MVVGEVGEERLSRYVCRFKLILFGNGPHIRMQRPPLTGLVGMELG
jgi:hypothetical protein